MDCGSYNNANGAEESPCGCLRITAPGDGDARRSRRPGRSSGSCSWPCEATTPVGVVSAYALSPYAIDEFHRPRGAVLLRMVYFVRVVVEPWLKRSPLPDRN